jgi:hypothetical protein
MGGCRGAATAILHKDIAVAFFLYPDAELNTDCVNAFKPVFVQPVDALPVVPAN